MTAPRLRDDRGAIAPDGLLGRGGEGSVHAIAGDSLRAVKLYAKPDERRRLKVTAMVEAGLAATCPGVAFPTSVVTDEAGAFAGFTMSRHDGCLPVHELFAPAARRAAFPAADWRFLLRAAANAARILARIHAAGAVVGDVNGSGLDISANAVPAAMRRAGVGRSSFGYERCRAVAIMTSTRKAP